MNWPIRLLICAAMAVVAIGIIVGARNKSERPQPSVESGANTDVSSHENPVEQLTIDPENGDPAWPAAVAGPSPAPKEDLLLTGLSGLGPNRCAVFAITRPGEADSSFTLHEGEENDWLKVLSVDLQKGRVKAILKRPVVRIRNIGAEVILSFDVHGKSL
jgi:hypothetical protein